MTARTATLERTTSESSVRVSLNLDGTGASTISTGVGFYDHMLDALGRHSLIDLTVRTEGDVSAFVSPRLAFGHGSPLGQAPWWCAAVFGLGLVDLVIARVWAARWRARSQPITPTFTLGEAPASYIPTDDGIRLEGLKTLAALRDSGALTDAEFESEKRRLLGG